MFRRLVPLIVSAALFGCFNFDAAYDQYCDAGHCSVDAGSTGGGGGATGGGTATGGGSTTGGGGATGGGTGTGGGGSTTGGGGGTTGGGGGSTGDAGCTQPLCLELDWTAPGRASPAYTVAPGLMAESIRRFNVTASFDTALAGTNFSHFEYRFVDGGLTSTINRTSDYDTRAETVMMRGVSLTDYWVTYRTYATHQETSGSSFISACNLADGGMSDPYTYGVLPMSSDEAWFVGWPDSICHWTRAGGLVSTNVPDENSRIYWYDLYRTPSGNVYVVGGDWNTTTSVGIGLITREDGTRVSADPVTDTYYDEAYASIDGVGETVYVLARSNANQRGEIHQLQPDGGFGKVYTASTRLAKLDVTPTGEVWAAGQNAGVVVHFDGTQWTELTLPGNAPNRSELSWENVQATPDGIVLSGFETQPDGGNTAVVNTYRFFGK